MKKSLLAIALFAAVLQPAAPIHAQRQSPKLVVLIAVDQMRGDYLERYSSMISKGFKRLTTDGTWFRNAAYPYLNTFTCVGHHTIGTGTFPYQHGMVQNIWFDRESQKSVACTADPKATNVIATQSLSGGGDSDANNRMPSLADIMRRDLKSRVVTMSIKARSAIGLAGHGGDAVVWLDERGRPETSTIYTPTAVEWVTAFARANPVTRDAGRDWERSLPADRYQYEDDAPGEKAHNGWGATFPHPLGEAGDQAYFGHWETSPYADQYLEELAEAAVDQMKLGQEDRTDFLGISFSSLDMVGHSYGPRSHEMQDMLYRLDATMGKLLEYLDKKVGAGNYVLALSADHGVADVPEQVEGGTRVLPQTISAAIEASIKPFLGDGGPFIAANLGSDIYFKPGVFSRIAANPKALAAMRRAALNVPGMARLLTRTEVGARGARNSKDPMIRAAAFSYYPDRSGDLMVVPKPNAIVGGGNTTTHGSPYRYDQNVPLIFFGGGIRGAGTLTAPATPADAAATLASIIGVRLPSPDGRVQSLALDSANRRHTTAAGGGRQ